MSLCSNYRIDENKISQALDWAYDKSLTGFKNYKSAESLAESYLNKYDNIEDAVNNLIKWQKAKCLTSGFITGLGGIMTLPVSIPSNLAAVFFVQLRMIASIAYMYGYDPRDDQVRTLCYVCLCGTAAKDIVKEAGIKISQNLTKNMIKNISGETIKRINQWVKFRLVTKFGERGIVNLKKGIPVVGGIIGGAFEFASASIVGKVAKEIFYNPYVNSPTLRA